jgi:hypothetical protein
MFMTNQQSAELTEPSIGSFDNPSALVAAQFPAIFISPLLVVPPVGSNQCVMSSTALLSNEGAKSYCGCFLFAVATGRKYSAGLNVTIVFSAP